MSPRDMEVLHYFLKNPNKLINLQELIDTVWKGRLVGDHAIYRVINKIRKHLDPSDKDAYIETIPKMGYKLSKSVEIVTSNTVQPSPTLQPVISKSNKDLDSEISESVTTSINKIPKPKSKFYLLFMVFVFLGGASYFLWQKVLGPQAYLRSLNTFGSFERLLTLPGFQAYPSSSKNGEFIVFSYKKKEGDSFDVYLKNIKTNEISRITNNKNTNINARVSDDAKNIFFVSILHDECKIIHYKFEENKYNEDVLLSCVNNADIDIEIDSKGKSLFYTYSDSVDAVNRLFSMQVDTGKRTQLTNYMSNQAIGDIEIALSNSQDKLYFIRKPSARETEVYEYIFSAQKENLLFKVDGELTDLKVNPNREALTYRKNATVISEYSLKYKIEKELISSLNERIYGYDFINVSNKMMIVSGDEENSIWQRNINSNFGLEQLTLSDYRDSVPRFANGSESIAFLSDRTGEMQIWLKLGESSEYQLTRFEKQGYINWLRWSPNDRYIICTNSETIFLVDVESGDVSFLAIDKDYTELRMPTWSNTGQDIYFSALYDSQIQAFKYNITQQSIEKVSDSGIAAVFDFGILKKYIVKAHRKGLWQLKNDTERLVLPNIGSAKFLQSIEFSDDGIYFIKDSSHQVYYQSYEAIDNGKEATGLGIEIPNKQFSVNSDLNKLIYSLTTEQNTEILISQ